MTIRKLLQKNFKSFFQNLFKIFYGKIIVPKENEVDYIISDLHEIPKIVEELCKQ